MPRRDEAGRAAMRRGAPRLLAGMLALVMGTAAMPAAAAAQSAVQGADRSPGIDVSPVPALPGTTHEAAAEVRITAEDEPGRPLRIAGRVRDATTGVPIAGATIVIYQADGGGEYEPSDPTDESSARLGGELTTDADGHFAFRTILPGEYPGSPPGNRHIHVHSVSAAGYRPRGFVILFDDNVGDEVRAWASATGFGQVIETAESDGLLEGSIDIRLEPVPAAVPGRLQDPAAKHRTGSARHD